MTANGFDRGQRLFGDSPPERGERHDPRAKYCAARLSG